MIRKRCLCGVALPIAMVVGVAHAQDVDSLQPGAEENADVGEIIVTARKGKERLIDVPSAVSAVQQTELVGRGITTLGDLTAVVPGLNMSPNIGGSNVILRGINTGSDNAAASGITVDGIPVGSSSSFAQGGSSGFDLDPFDLERVEVLRGPQGTLYGASTLGGLVSYVTRKPSVDEFSGSVQGEASFTRHGEGSHLVRGAIEGPIVPGKVGARLSGFNDKRGGYIDNGLTSTKDINGFDRYGGRAALRFQMSENIILDIAALYQKSKAEGLDFTVVTAAGQPRDGSYLNYNEYFVPNRNSKMQLYTGALSIDLGSSISLNYLGSYQDSNAANYSNTTSDRLAGTFRAIGLLGLGPVLATPLVESRDYLIDLRKQTHELRLDGAFGSFKWLLGGYYTREKAFQTQAERPRTIVGVTAGSDPLLKLDLDSKYKEYAAFGNLTFSPVEALEVTGGFRIGKNEQTYQQFASGTSLAGLNSLLPAASRFPAATAPASSKETVKTFLASAKYSFSRNAMIYARFATGYRPGGPNVTGPGASPTYNHDTVDSYEFGIKAQNSSRTLSADITAYYLKWKDIQIFKSVGGFSSRANGKDASVRGVEATINVAPTPGLKLGLTAAYTDSQLDEAIPEISGIAGETLPNTPRWSSNLAIDYTWELSRSWDAFVGGSIKMISDRQTNFLAYAQAPGIRLDGYSTSDMRIGARGDSLELSLFARNIFDSEALLGGRSLHGLREVVVVRPRTIGMMAKLDF
jgi:iron complex outermembrane recepter protein